ncbi:ABC transporter permease [Corynebacterium auris]|uniref:ABC transporter permease n=1 Tax=Corynebacterium auris TaxID=44750 RepID=UPI0025B5B4AC|nr:ABC transporter permease [Corynebacterium auris]WJY68701.1 Macrolide export ATP-binding/permease protein MacB [Corynebacterium auris]
MMRVSLRNIAAHKLRLALTVLAVVLGTAFIAGSLMFTNMLERTFDQAVGSRYDGVGAVVRPGEGSAGVDLAVLDEMEGYPEAGNVNASGTTVVVAARADETTIQTSQGVSTVGIYYGPDEAVAAAPEVVEGAEPAVRGEAVVNANAAEAYGIGIGEELIVVDPNSRRDYTVVGYYTDELTPSSSVALLTTPSTYIEFYREDETAPEALVSAAEGVSAESLVDALRAAHPDLSIETGEATAQEAEEAIREGLNFVSYFLVAFGLVGLLVGTFLIANTFSMIVAQRTKEFALLRALGASRGQITRSVSVEALIVGLIGSAVGVVVGAGLVALIKAVMDANGMELPPGGLGLSVDAVVVPIVVGTAVTLVSAWAPARRAGRVRPVEAMRSGESAAPQPLAARTWVGVVLIAAGIAAAVGGIAWEDGTVRNRAILVGVAAVGTIAGLFLAGPAFSLPLVPPFGRLIGAPFGSVGKLAATNTRRNPRRTSATAFALMLGVALVAIIGMLGASMRESVAEISRSEVRSEFILSGPVTGPFPLPAELSAEVRETAGVAEVVTYSEAPVTVDGEYSYSFGPYGATPVFSGNPSDLFVLDITEGQALVDENTVIAPREYAQERGWSVGDTIAVGAPGISAETVEVTLGGVFEPSTLLQGVAVSRDTAVKLVPESTLTIQMLGVNGDGTVEPEELRANLEEAAQPYIVAQVRSPEEMSGEIGAMIDQMLFILYALLSLAVVIAVLGIVNTLTLSVIERRQEIGMLRAVGTQRGQVRTLIILESVQMAVFGAVAGILLGLGLGWAFLTVLREQGLNELVVPWPLVVVMLLGSLVVGILAALWPAQRAAATPPLDAIAD